MNNRLKDDITLIGVGFIAGGLTILYIYVFYHICAPCKANANYYKSDLNRQEMKEALEPAINSNYSLFVPGDSSVLPYLIKNK